MHNTVIFLRTQLCNRWGFNGVRGVEGGWAVELAVFGLFFVGFGVFAGWFGGFNSVRVLTWHGCGCRWRWRRVVCVDFMAIDLDGALMWQPNGLWVAVRQSETV